MIKKRSKEGELYLKSTNRSDAPPKGAFAQLSDYAGSFYAWFTEELR